MNEFKFLIISGLFMALVIANEDIFNQTEATDPIQDEITSTDFLAENTTLVSAPNTSAPSITVHINGMSPSDFKRNLDRFKVIMSNLTNIFIVDKHINVKQSNSSNIKLLSIDNCPENWSDNENCTKLNFSIPLTIIENEAINNESMSLDVNEESAINLTKLELSEVHLFELWNTYSAHSIIEEFGIKPYQPNNDLVLLIWVSISLGILCAFLVVLYIIWKSDFFAQYSSLGDKLISPHNSQFDHSRPSQTDSVFHIVNRTNTQNGSVIVQNGQSKIPLPKYDASTTEKSFSSGYSRKPIGNTLPTVAEEQDDGFINVALDSDDDSEYETEFTLKKIQNPHVDKRSDTTHAKTNSKESVA